MKKMKKNEKNEKKWKKNELLNLKLEKKFLIFKKFKKI